MEKLKGVSSHDVFWPIKKSKVNYLIMAKFPRTDYHDFHLLMLPDTPKKNQD